MTDSEFPTIQPVENLQNVASLTPTGPRRERKRRQSAPRRDAEQGEAPPDQDAAEHENDSHRIDYRA